MSNSSAKNIDQNTKCLLPIDHLKHVAEELKCISHPHRLRIIEILLSGEHTVDEIAKLCHLSQPATSGHLRLMEGKGLLSNERRGRAVYYSVIHPQLSGILQCIQDQFNQS